MRNHFLAPVLRQQFTLYYRFGYTFLPDALLIPFDGVITQAEKDAVTKLLSQITPFEYDEEYVILHLQQEGEPPLPGNLKFDIQELTVVYPLSEQARVSISQKIDSRIVLGKPLFASSLAAAEEAIIYEEVNKGIESLWNIYLDEAIDKDQTLVKIGLSNILHALTLRSQGKKAGELTGENYWSYLLTYERYQYFPKEPIGYFFDAGELFAFSKGKPTFENSHLHQLLIKLYTANSKVSFKKIVIELEENALAAGYINQTKIGELRLYVLAPLFLLLKDEIRNAENLTSVKGSAAFSYARGAFPLEFKAAIILLGAFFKFKAFYDEYYNVINLDIYHPQLQLPATKEKAEQNSAKLSQETIQSNVDNNVITETTSQIVTPVEVSNTEELKTDLQLKKLTEINPELEPNSNGAFAPSQKKIAVEQSELSNSSEEYVKGSSTSPANNEQDKKQNFDSTLIDQDKLAAAEDFDTQLGFKFNETEVEYPATLPVKNKELKDGEASFTSKDTKGKGKKVSAEASIKKAQPKSETKQKSTAKATLLNTEAKENKSLTPGETLEFSTKSKEK